MAVLATFENKTYFESDDIVVPAAGTVRVLVRGKMGLRGVVRVLLKGSDGNYHAYDDMTFRHGDRAVGIVVLDGDVLRIQCQRCEGVTVEVAQ